MEELNITVPVALHLDHGTYEGCKKCIDAGFSSIMFDGSHYPFEENWLQRQGVEEMVHTNFCKMKPQEFYRVWCIPGRD